MNFIQENLSFWRWYLRVMGAFLQARPVTTTVVVAATTIGHVTGFLALMLPLKVILLAGSEGVPTYFRFLIQPEHKFPWIIGLALGAIALYIGTRLLEALASRLSGAVSREVLGSANELSVVSNQESEAQSHYSRFCNVCAYTVFSVVALAVIFVIDRALFLFLAVAIPIQFLFSAWAVSGNDDAVPEGVKAFLFDKTSSYMRVLVSINFLSGFLIILAPFLFDPGRNILFAIVSILLLRQMLNAMSSAVVSSVTLEQRRDRINTLVFREHQFEDQEKRYSVALRDFFPKEERQRMAEHHLQAPDASVDAHWEDSHIPGVTTLSISLDHGKGGIRRYQQQIYPPAQAHQLRNEELLFKYVPRSALWAPEVVARFSQGPFECQICEYGEGVPLERKWRHWERPLLSRHMLYSPPARLIDAYSATHRLLQDRLGPELLKRIEIAVDTAEEAELLSALRVSLPKVRKRLRRMPVFVHNPDMTRFTTVSGERTQSVLVMTWRRWTLEPVGAVLPSQIADDALEALLADIHQGRNDRAADLTIEDLRFNHACWSLDRFARTGRHKTALEQLPVIMASDSAIASNRQVG